MNYIDDRRIRSSGRRVTDDEPTFCGDHKWLVKSIDEHTTKLNKFLVRVNATLVTVCLALIVMLGNMIIEHLSVGG